MLSVIVLHCRPEVNITLTLYIGDSFVVLHYTPLVNCMCSTVIWFYIYTPWSGPMIGKIYPCQSITSFVEQWCIVIIYILTYILG